MIQILKYSEKPEGDMEREGWVALNDRGCPFTINLHAHYFRKKKSLCEKYAIVDDANLVESYSDVNYCPVCDLKVQQRTCGIDSHAHDVAKERWEWSRFDTAGGSDDDILYMPIEGEKRGQRLVCRAGATDAQAAIMESAPQILEALEEAAAYFTAHWRGLDNQALPNKIKTAIKKARGGE